MRIYVSCMELLSNQIFVSNHIAIASYPLKNITVDMHHFMSMHFLVHKDITEIIANVHI